MEGELNMPAKKKAAKKKVAKKKVRCAALTKDGEKCKLMAKPPAKFCHLHKGWKPPKKKVAKKKARRKK